MAEIAISTASVLVGVVVPLLTQYVNDDLDLLEEIKSMEGWLGEMMTFIELNGGNECRPLIDRVRQLRNIAYDIEDVLDELILHSPHVFQNHKSTQRIHRFAHDLKFGFPLKKLKAKIMTIKKSLVDINVRNGALWADSSVLKPESSSTTRTRYRVSPLLLDDELVGYEKERSQFNLELIEGEKQLVTLAVVGRAGSGKTTFVKTVYGELRIQGRFDCNAWVQVSRHFDMDKILVNLLKQFCDSRKEPCPDADESLTPHEKIRKYVGTKSYIVVLDDIWTAEDWNSIKDAFPNAFCGSRIIVTTRNVNVAKICASSDEYKYPLHGLEWLQSWKLFCSKAFQHSNRECPAQLKDCSVKIVERCEGLPLAIVAVGSALAQKKKNPCDWEKFHLNLGCEPERDSHLSVISNTLLQSYVDLSSSLKSCFLYFSIFPEDVSVEYGRLIRLWVAERFASGTDQETAEEVAADYLNELIHRNLVHVSKWNFDGRPRSCRVLNLVHKFIIQKCKDENFAAIITEQNTSASNKIRRLSFHGDCTSLSPHIDLDGVRALFLFRCTYVSPKFIWNNTSRFQLSRLIDFQGAPLVEFPGNITNLTLLTYISFRNTKIKTIPKSIQKLFHLQTLDLKQTDVMELPKEISKLHNLRHLLAYKYTVGDYTSFDTVQAVKIFEGIGNLTELQKLSLVRIDGSAGILKELPKLCQLKKLGLTGITKEHCTDLCRSIEGMRNLSALDLRSNTRDGYIELDDISHPPDTLQQLYLKGRMKCIPDWITKLRNLLKIRLRWSKLEESPIETLKCLPNLLEIEMVDCYIGEELVFMGSIFKRLKVLIIQDLPELHTIVIEEGSIRDLQQMSLRRCPKLMMPPFGLELLFKIKEVFLYDMAEELVSRIRIGGKYRWVVEHIPIIHIQSITHEICRRSLKKLSNSFYYREVASQSKHETHVFQ